MEPDEIAARVWPGRDLKLEPLGGGITNRNFKIDVDGDSFVLRIGGKDTALLGIDRDAEHAATLVAAGLGIAPEVAAYVEPEGYLVTRYIVGRGIPPEEMRREDVLRRVAETIRRIHDGPPFPSTFDSFRVVETYAEIAAAHGVTVPDAYERSKETADSIERTRGREPARPCHNDFLNLNFIAADGAIRIVDWEYAGMGDRFFDLANFSINHELDDAGNEQLLRAYFGRVDPSDMSALRLMRFMSDFREAMWAVVQQGISELDFDYRRLRGRALRAARADGGRARVSVGLMRDRSKAVVIGGGVGGAAVLYWLARLGWEDVVLVERADLTSGSTFHSAGLVGQLRGSLSLTKMMMRSVDLYRTLEDEVGLETGWHEVGSLRLASSEERMEELARQAGWAQTFGLPLELISAEDARRLFPPMSTDGVLGAAYLPTDGYIDPSQLTFALAEGARRRGAELYTNTRVTAIEVDGGRVRGVETDKGPIETGIVVNAGGMFAAEIGAMAGVIVPIVPMAHEYLITKPGGPPARPADDAGPVAARLLPR